jgi:hypothetical protein
MFLANTIDAKFTSSQPIPLEEDNVMPSLSPDSGANKPTIPLGGND